MWVSLIIRRRQIKKCQGKKTASSNDLHFRKVELTLREPNLILINNNAGSEFMWCPGFNSKKKVHSEPYFGDQNNKGGKYLIYYCAVAEAVFNQKKKLSLCTFFRVFDAVISAVLVSISSTFFCTLFSYESLFLQLFLVTFLLWRKICTKNAYVKRWWNRQLNSHTVTFHIQ